jgi:hypothetical protein
VAVLQVRSDELSCGALLVGLLASSRPRLAPRGHRSEAKFSGPVVNVEAAVEREGDQELVPLVDQVGDALLQGLGEGKALRSWARAFSSPKRGTLRSCRSSRRWEAVSERVRASASMR